MTTAITFSGAPMDSKAYIRYRCELNGKEYTPIGVANNCDKAFQKVVNNSKGEKRYFINYYLYEPSRSIPEVGYRIAAEVHMYRNDQTDWFVVEYQATDNGNVKQIEAFFEELYEKMGCQIDPHNND